MQIPGINPRARCIPLIEDIDMGVEGIIGGTEGPWRVGGMVTKIEAAKKTSRFGIPTIIARGTKEGILHQILSGKEIGTLILPKAEDPQQSEGMDCLSSQTQRRGGR